MGRLIQLEIRKMLFKKRVVFVWISVLLLSSIMVTDVSVKETYADLFNKAYNISPLIGLLMFMVFSGVYSHEQTSNMSGLIKSTKNGRKEIVIAKSIAAGTAASIISLSVFLTMCLFAVKTHRFAGLSLPVKELWYFGNSGSGLTVLQVIVVMIVSITIGAFFFAQVGLFLSVISKSAAVPFLFGGIIMGFPYLLEEPLKRAGLKGILCLTPLWGMMSCQLIRYGAQKMTIIAIVLIFAAGIFILPNIVLNVFMKEE